MSTSYTYTCNCVCIRTRYILYNWWLSMCNITRIRKSSLFVNAKYYLSTYNNLNHILTSRCLYTWPETHIQTQDNLYMCNITYLRVTRICVVTHVDEQQYILSTCTSLNHIQTLWCLYMYLFAHIQTSICLYTCNITSLHVTRIRVL